MWVSPWQVESAESTRLVPVGAARDARRSALPDVGERAPSRVDPDRELVARVVTGDVEAYEELLVRHRGRIRAIALRMLGGAADADDVGQEVAILLWTSLSSFTGGSSFSTWLHRVVVNRCLDHRRRGRVTAEIENNDHPVVPGADRHVLLRAELAAGLAVLASLPEAQRAAVVLVRVEGLTYRQAAAVLGVPEATVRGRLARARADLVRAARRCDV